MFRLLGPCLEPLQSVDDGAGKSVLACAWMQLLKLRKTATPQCAVRREAQHDVRKRRPHGGHGGPAGVDAGHVPEQDPRLSFPARVQHVAQGGRELQDRGRVFPAVL